MFVTCCRSFKVVQAAVCQNSLLENLKCRKKKSFNDFDPNDVSTWKVAASGLVGKRWDTYSSREFHALVVLAAIPHRIVPAGVLDQKFDQQEYALGLEAGLHNYFAFQNPHPQFEHTPGTGRQGPTLVAAVLYLAVMLGQNAKPGTDKGEQGGKPILLFDKNKDNHQINETKVEAVQGGKEKGKGKEKVEQREENTTAQKREDTVVKKTKEEENQRKEKTKQKREEIVVQKTKKEENQQTEETSQKREEKTDIRRKASKLAMQRINQHRPTK